MKTLILLRHAEAAGAAGVMDFERTLTARGRDMAAHVGKQLAAKGMWPDVVLCSAAARTRETCTLVLEEWRGDMQPDVTHAPALYGAEVNDIIEIIHTQDDKDACIMVIGHNPTIHMLSLLLPKAGETQKYARLASDFPPASCVIMQCEVQNWNALKKSTTTLIEYFSP